MNRATYCALAFSLLSLQTSAQCTSAATNAADEDILNVTFGTLNNNSTCATTGGAGSTLNMYSNYTGVAAPNVTKCTNVNFSVQIGTCGGSFSNSLRIFIDWNNDLDFADAGETVYTSAVATLGAHTETGTIAIPGNAVTGTVRMRVVNVETSTPTSITSCGTYSWGETEDYMINVVAGAALTYTSSTTTQIVSGSVPRCDLDRQIISVPVIMGAGCSSNLTQFILGAGSSTNLLTDVSKIHIYYTGTTNTFAATNEFVSGGTTPTGAANTINGTQALVTGTNYFWICYDLYPGSTVGNSIDGSCTQITVAGVNQTPTATNPAGSGTIAACTPTPGGVGGVTLWLKANAGTNTTTDGAAVNSWASQAASPAVTVTQATASAQPTYRVGSGSGTTNRFNYNPFVYTDGSSNRLTASGDINLGTITNGMSAFQAIGEDMGIVSMEWYHSANGNIKMKGDGLLYFNKSDGSTQQNVGSGPTTVPACILDLKGAPGAVNGNGRYNGNAMGTYGNGWRIATTTGISIGSNMDNGEFMQGGMGEYIVFPSSLSATNTLRVESYLAVKYGVTLGSSAAVSDYLSSTGGTIWTGNSTYQNNILGIGRDDNSALTQRQSHQYDDSVRIYKGTLSTTNVTNAATFAQDISFVLMGANTGKLCTTAAALAEMPTGLTNCTLYSRLEREWRVIRTNMAETFNIDIKLNSCGAPGSVNVNDLRLLVDDDGNFANGGTQCYYIGDGTGINFSYSNPTISVQNISTTHIPNNATKFITIASINIATPLPVELLYFNAELNDQRQVDLTWKTETEFNSDQFEIYRSKDITDWEFVGKYPAAGTSYVPLNYATVDEAPFTGTTYYRLKIWDKNGSSAESEIRAVYLELPGTLTVYPNPADEIVTVTGIGLTPENLQVRNSIGQDIPIHSVASGKNAVVVSIDQLAAGVYFISYTGQTDKCVKLIVQ